MTTPRRGGRTPGGSRWRRVAHRLGSPWAIGLIGVLVVIGIGIGVVLAIDAALDAERRAEKTIRAVDLTEDVVEVVSTLQDERGRAARFLVDRSEPHLVAYLESFERTDAAANALVATWAGQAADRVETDLEALIGPIEELPGVRQSILESGGEESAIELYSGLLAPLSAELTALFAAQGLVTLSPQNALIELLAAIESAAVRRTVGIRILGQGGPPISRESEVLLRVETRRLGARFDAATTGSSFESELLDDLLGSEGFATVDTMLDELLETQGEGGAFSFSEAEWFEATSTQIDEIRATARAFAMRLRDAATEEAADAENRFGLVSVLGGALLFAAVVAVWGSVSASRDRLAALRAHTDLVDRLRSWFVPRSLPAVSGLRLELRYLPSPGGVAAGGDWYDVVQRPDGSIAFAIGDVAGHGPGAVARMAELKNTLRGVAVASASSDPASELEALDSATVSSRLLATACYSVLDPPRGVLRYSRAGHLPALLRRPGGEVEILDEGGGPPLGVEPGRSRSSAEVDFAPGSVLLMFTDGLIEAPGGDMMRAVRQVARVFENAGNDLAHLADLLVAMRPTRTRADDLSLLIAHWTAEDGAT
jgi:hypothetical protein